MEHGHAGTGKFVCLAEYWCLCIPVGKPVSERTMDRHRKLVNDRRASLGLPMLQRGPRYSAERELYQYNRRASMGATLNPFSPFFRAEEARSSQISSVATENDSFADSVSNESQEIEEFDQAWRQNTSVGGGDASGSTTRTSPSTTLDAANILPAADFGSGHPLGDVETENSVEAAGNNGNRSSSITDYRASLIEGSDQSVQESDSGEGQRMRSHAMIRFQSWAIEEKEWIETFVEFGITDRLMGRLLKLKKAPIVPITLKRNLIKYSGFETALYHACLGHMLIGELFSDRDSEDMASHQPCLVCSEKGTSLTFSTFEYIKLLPRFRSWVANQESCRVLFESRHEQLSQRCHMAHDFGPGIFYSDIIDGELFRRIADKSGGLASTEYDITLAVSCDGFQTFGNNSYDCWPIVALNHNLPSSMRFLIHNLVPLGFIKGPSEPVRLDTFLTPMFEEVSKINENGGTSMMFFDGIERVVRVHIVVVTGDSPAVAKLAGITGSNGKTSCRLCDHQGVYCTTSRHYYFPSKVLVPAEGRVRRYWKTLYDIDNPSMRSRDSIGATLNLLETAENMTRAQRERIQRDTGIKKRTVTLQFSTIFTYESFPLDTMHLIMNVAKDMMELLRGENRITNREPSEAEEFVISHNSLRRIDSEIESIGGGTASSAFGNAPRATTEYRSWKAVECKDFFRWYAVILFEGHISSAALGGIRTFGAIIERCTWPNISQEGVDDLKRLCREFVKHFEDRYFKYDLERVTICKSTIHALLHLGRTVELCGPLVNVNQFWVERYIGAVKHRFHAKNLAAEALTENAKMMEAYKMYFKEHFRINDDNAEINQARGSFSISGVCLLTPVDQESLRDPFHVRTKTQKLLEEYVRRTEGLAEAEAKRVVSNASIWSYGRVRVRKDGNATAFGAMKARRHRKDMKRVDYYISCEFIGDTENRLDVYYGRILKILHVRYELNEEFHDMPIVLIDWALRLKRTAHDQVYKRCKSAQAFETPSVEHTSVLSGSIGILEHRIPGSASVRTYFVDPARDINCLLHANRAGPDGKSRNLKVL